MPMSPEQLDKFVQAISAHDLETALKILSGEETTTKMSYRLMTFPLVRHPLRSHVNIKLPEAYFAVGIAVVKTIPTIFAFVDESEVNDREAWDNRTVVFMRVGEQTHIDTDSSELDAIVEDGYGFWVVMLLSRGHVYSEDDEDVVYPEDAEL